MKKGRLPVNTSFNSLLIGTLQRYLYDLGIYPDIKPCGVFGPDTRQSLKTFLAWQTFYKTSKLRLNPRSTRYVFFNPINNLINHKPVWRTWTAYKLYKIRNFRWRLLFISWICRQIKQSFNVVQLDKTSKFKYSQNNYFYCPANRFQNYRKSDRTHSRHAYF